MKINILPINLLVIFLSFLALTACFSLSGFDLLAWTVHTRNAAALALAGLFTHTVLVNFRAVSPFRFIDRAISYLILFLLFDPLSQWWIFPLLGAVTELCQTLMRSTAGPFFNPAGLTGLLFSLTGVVPDWWGVSFAPRINLITDGMSIVAPFTLLIAGYVAYRYHKLGISFSALVTFSLSYRLLFGQIPLFITLEGTLLFFLLIMVIEPKTSPVANSEQYFYGGLIGLLISIGIYFGFVEVYLIALFLANLFHRRHSLQKFFSSQKNHLKQQTAFFSQDTRSAG